MSSNGDQVVPLNHNHNCRRPPLLGRVGAALRMTWRKIPLLSSSGAPEISTPTIMRRMMMIIFKWRAPLWVAVSLALSLLICLPGTG